METVVSDVSRCLETSCVFNTDEKCHTMAINVGGPEPLCDTFMTGSMKGGDQDMLAKVGTCKVAQCRYNNAYECEAVNISIVDKDGKPVCGTYKFDFDI